MDYLWRITYQFLEPDIQTNLTVAFAKPTTLSERSEYREMLLLVHHNISIGPTTCFVIRVVRLLDLFSTREKGRVLFTIGGSNVFIIFPSLLAHRWAQRIRFSDLSLYLKEWLEKKIQTRKCLILVIFLPLFFCSWSLKLC